MPITVRADQPTYVLPEAVYAYQPLLGAIGFSYDRVKAARLKGIHLPVLKVGKRLYVRGSDAIRFIEQLAEQTAAEKEAKGGTA
jgi:hypothetical protein